MAKDIDVVQAMKSDERELNMKRFQDIKNARLAGFDEIAKQENEKKRTNAIAQERDHNESRITAAGTLLAFLL